MLVAESREMVCFNVEKKEKTNLTQTNTSIRKSLQQISRSIFSPHDTGSNKYNEICNS